MSANESQGRPKDLRVNSCTLSLSSFKSSCVGGTKPFGCFEEAARLMFSGLCRRLGRHVWRKHCESILGAIGEAIVISMGKERFAWSCLLPLIIAAHFPTKLGPWRLPSAQAEQT
jgi:hypothetical protein